MTAIKIYTAVKMSYRFKDEVRLESDMLVRVLSNHGFEVLNPVIEESIPSVHETIDNVPSALLESYWRRDKEMIRDADILLDYKTQNQSDGANKEIAYARYTLWKPVVRVWGGNGALISRIEDDVVVESLNEAIGEIKDRWGTYEQLREWREEMLKRSLLNWDKEQRKMSMRYNCFGMGGN